MAGFIVRTSSRMHRLALFLVACGSTPPAPSQPTPVPDPPDAPAAPLPDTGPPAAVLSAPAFVFRYHTADRSEIWTLQHADGHALLVVDSAKGALRYHGTATEGATLALDVSTGSAKLALACKREKLAVSAKCNDSKAKPIDVLNCYHPDFTSPMSFAPAPGIEYVALPGCTGFRLR